MLSLSSIFNWFIRLKNGFMKWCRHNVSISKPASVLLGLVFAHGLAKNAVLDVLMVYVTEDWEKPNIMKAAAIVNIEEAISGFFGIIIYLLTEEASLGRFKMVFFTTTSFVLGLVLLWLWKLDLPQESKFPIFYVALLLISFGKAGKDPPFKNFFRDQLSGNDDEQIEDRAKFLWRVFKFAGAAISVLFLATQTWKVTFLISASVMGAAYLMFLLGKFCPYTYTPPTENYFSSVYKVVKYAFTKRCLPYPRTPSGYFLNERNEELILPRVLRCLDKAAIVTQASPSQHQEEEENLCSVGEVRQTKTLLRLIPLWFGFFIYGIVIASGNTFFIEQSSGLHETIPINSFFIIICLVSLVTSYLANLLLSRYCTNEEWRLKGGLFRVGAGMAISIVCFLVASRVEHVRLNAIKIHGDPDEHENGDLHMSILWLVPQFILLGLMDGLSEDGLSELFYVIVDESMEGLETPINQFILGIGKAGSVICVFVFRDWFGHTINTSRLDKYFNMLMYLSIGNLVYFLAMRYYYVSVHKIEPLLPQQEAIEREGGGEGEGEGEEEEEGEEFALQQAKTQLDGIQQNQNHGILDHVLSFRSKKLWRAKEEEKEKKMMKKNLLFNNQKHN